MPVRRGAVAALMLVAGLAGCTDISTDPEVPLSLQFDSLPALAVVVGDTMRGADLEPARVPVRAFNAAGDTITEAAIRLTGIDSASVSAFQALPGLRIVGRTLTSAVRVVAQAGSLQSQTQTFAVISAPTGLVKDNIGSDSIRYVRGDTLRLVDSADVKVAVVRTTGLATRDSVNGLRVRFRVDSFSTDLLDSVRLVGTGSNRTASSALTTGNTATIRVKVYRKRGTTASGAVWLEAAIRALGADVPGSPLKAPVTVAPATTTP